MPFYHCLAVILKGITIPQYVHNMGHNKSKVPLLMSGWHGAVNLLSNHQFLEHLIPSIFLYSNTDMYFIKSIHQVPSKLISK